MNFFSFIRRALKATFVLIPLFGVQLAVTIYRPPPESPISLYYERVSDVITNSQVRRIYKHNYVFFPILP